MRQTRVSQASRGQVSENHALAPESRLSCFETSLGWIGLLGQEAKLVAVFAGYPSAAAVRSKARSAHPAFVEQDFDPELRELFVAYSEGEAIDFSSVEVELPKLTPFRKQVLKATRNLGYGQTVTYGELAAKAGHPRAARAVGTVMSSNCFPILIPCHRVLAAGGRLGGYTSPAGTKLKIRLLELEARSAGRPLEVASFK